ncbi:Cerato-ulmin hydrophobin family [Mariannaea sp. PMI_226]|nr:Cerato-ulmin hydrophobin family [Mariannaea sp. PMI_226]
MRFAAVVVTLHACLVAAVPTTEKRQIYIPCSGLYKSAQCCATDVLGVADLDCGNPSTTPTSGDDFKSICAAGGQRARCCVLPILDQGILCNDPSGVTD